MKLWLLAITAKYFFHHFSRGGWAASRFIISCHLLKLSTCILKWVRQWVSRQNWSWGPQYDDEHSQDVNKHWMGPTTLSWLMGFQRNGCKDQLEAAVRSQDKVAETLLSSSVGWAGHQISSPCYTSLCTLMVVLVGKGPKQRQNEPEALARAGHCCRDINVVPASLWSEGTGKDGDKLKRSTWFHTWCWWQAFRFCQW